MISHRKKMIKDLKVWFDLQHTDPAITHCILSVLQTCGHTTFCLAMEPLTSDEMYHRCALSQDLIGWNNFHFGRISVHWITLQREYLQQKYATKNSQRRLRPNDWLQKYIKSHDQYGDIDASEYTATNKNGNTDERKRYSGRKLLCNINLAILQSARLKKIFSNYHNRRLESTRYGLRSTG